MTTHDKSQHLEQDAPSEQDDPVLGRRLHLYEAHAKAVSKDKTRRQLEIVGVLAVLMIPISLMYVKGTTGTVLAAAGGAVAVLAYFLSARKPSVRTTTISLHERGVVCAEGDAQRQVLWNEVVEVKSKRFPLPDGRVSTVIALEVVGAPPLLFVLSGSDKDKDKTNKLLEALSGVWVPVWCRRARAQLEAGRDVELGRARMSGDSLAVERKHLAWEAIQGVESTGQTDELRTSDGVTPVEGEGQVVPFPSTARRLAALAEVPPSRPLLPAPRK